MFKAWTDAEHLARWLGPQQFTNPVCEVDARPGGALRIDMRGPDGTIYPNTGTFHEVVEPERLVFTIVALNDKRESIIDALYTVTFADRGGKTVLTCGRCSLRRRRSNTWPRNTTPSKTADRRSAGWLLTSRACDDGATAGLVEIGGRL